MTAPHAVTADTPASGGVALEISNLYSGYGRTTILRDVSISVPASQVTALLGPNGAGKTTLLRTVSGLVPATRGRIFIHGVDVTKVSAQGRANRGLCHIPEGRGIFRSLSVRENIVMQAHKGSEAVALERACAVFPILCKRIRQIAGTLSGGEQQMLAMAAAYVGNPSLVLVDEASLGLAPKIVDEIFAFLQIATAEGAALLLVDQFASRALALASTAYVIRQGQIVYRGPSRDLAHADIMKQYLGSS